MEQARTLMLPNPAAMPRGDSMAMRKHRKRVSRVAFRLLEAVLAFVFLGAVVHHVFTFDFKPLAALCIPILVVFLAFASLLYNRGRSLAKSKGQMRSLYAVWAIAPDCFRRFGAFELRRRVQH